MKALVLFLWHLSQCLLTARADDPFHPPPPPFNEAHENGSVGYYPHYEYVTLPKVRSPKTNWLQYDERCDDGLQYFIAPRGYSDPRPGPMILDRRGELVWAHHFENKFGGQAYDLMVQKYDGEDYLTFWLGDDRVRGHGSGAYYMLNSHYEIVHKVDGANGLSADLHEFLITPQGTALLTIYQIIPGNVSMFREFDPEKTAADREPNWIWDCAFQEVNIATGELVFQWRASEHYNVTDTYRQIGPGGNRQDPFDWFHINSMSKDELGNFLISARYTHTLTYIDGKTQEIIWQLGGKQNDFMDLSGGNATNFAWQHDARFVPLDTFPNMYTPPVEKPGYTTKLVTVFDNAAEDRNYNYGLPLSRGLLLEVTYPTPGSRKAKRPGKGVHQNTIGDIPNEERQPLKMESLNRTDPDYTVRVIKSYENPNHVRSSSQGSMQVLPQGSDGDPRILVGYGLNAVFTEFDANGTTLCDTHFAARMSWERGDMQSYRAYKFEWHGFPQTPPSADITDDDAEVYVSWNGATEVASWVLQCAEAKDTYNEQAWSDITEVPKITFETVIPYPKTIGEARYLRVIALDSAGRRLEYGTTPIMDRGIMASYFPSIHAQLPPPVARLTPAKIFMIIVCNLSLLCLLYEIYRRYLVWSHGRGGGPLRWRGGAMYKLIGEA